MNGGYNVAQVTQALEAQSQSLQHQIAAAEQLRAQHAHLRGQLEQQWASAIHQLSEHLLPALNPQTAQGLQSAAGFDHLVRADMVGARERERGELAAFMQRNDADPRWLRRDNDRLVAEHRLREALSALAPLQQAVGAYEALPGFAELYASGYGTDDYAVPFWRVSYYNHWKHGDMACEALGVASFGQIRQDYLRNLHARNTLAEEESAARQALARVDQMAAARRDAQERFQNLDAIYLWECRRRLFEHLRSLDLKYLVMWNAGNRVVEALAKLALGVAAKIRYLDALVVEQVDKPIAAARQALSKNHRDMVKLSRPKNQWKMMPVDQFQRRFRDRSGAYQKRWHRYTKSRNAIIVFDRYQAYDPFRDMLWWDLMTDGRIDGNMIPEVNAYYHAHPSYRYERTETDDSSERFEQMVPSLADQDRELDRVEMS